MVWLPGDKLPRIILSKHECYKYVRSVLCAFVKPEPSLSHSFFLPKFRLRIFSQLSRYYPKCSMFQEELHQFIYVNLFHS